MSELIFWIITILDECGNACDLYTPMVYMRLIPMNVRTLPLGLCLNIGIRSQIHDPNDEYHK
jgi:hypothetical protein